MIDVTLHKDHVLGCLFVEWMPAQLLQTRADEIVVLNVIIFFSLYNCVPVCHYFLDQNTSKTAWTKMHVEV
jgi:hypothetical protein